MDVSPVVARLEALGSLCRRAFNARLGATADRFVVRLGELRALTQSLGRQPPQVATALWRSGNVEAQPLAFLLLNPGDVPLRDLERMIRSTNGAQVADWLNVSIVRKHPDAPTLRHLRREDEDRWVRRAGWSLTADRVVRRSDGSKLSSILERIEAEMASARLEANRTVNAALGALGVIHERRRAPASAIGERVGLSREWPVSKGCPSPHTPVWVETMVGRDHDAGPRGAARRRDTW